MVKYLGSLEQFVWFLEGLTWTLIFPRFHWMLWNSLWEWLQAKN